MTIKPKDFSKEARLTKPYEFKRVKDFGRVVSSSLFLMSYGININHRRRLGLVVSSIIKRAVDRNRIKRCIREHFRNNRDKYPQTDIVFVAKQKAEKATNKEIFEDIDVILRKTK